VDTNPRRKPVEGCSGPLIFGIRAFLESNREFDDAPVGVIPAEANAR
jgi:hypothetical protein